MTPRHTDTDGDTPKQSKRALHTRPGVVIPLALVVTIAGVVGGVAFGYGRVSQRVDGNESRIERMEQRVVTELAAINRKLDMLFQPRHARQ